RSRQARVVGLVVGWKSDETEAAEEENEAGVVEVAFSLNEGGDVGGPGGDAGKLGPGVAAQFLREEQAAMHDAVKQRDGGTLGGDNFDGVVVVPVGPGWRAGSGLDGFEVAANGEELLVDPKTERGEGGGE